MKNKEELNELNQVCFWLIKQCLDGDVETMEIDHKDVTVLGEPKGSWKIIVKKL